MSAPETNTEKQKKQHKGPLSGMVLAVIFALVLLAGLMIYLFFRGNEPADSTPIGAEQTEIAPDATIEAE